MFAQTLLPWLFIFVQILFWIYIASCFSKDVFFNLYINRTRTLLFHPVTWVQSITPRCPEWIAAALLLLFTILLHAAFAKAANRTMPFTFGYTSLFANLSSVASAVLFGFASFVIVVCQINFVRLGMLLRLGKRTTNAIPECLSTVCWPLSLPRIWISALVTVGTLALATFLLTIASTTSPDLAKLVSLTLTAIADVLLLVRHAIIVLIVIYIIGLVTGRIVIMGMVNEWLTAISRIVITKQLTLGMLCLTPLVICFITELAHALLIGLINKLP